MRFDLAGELAAYREGGLERRIRTVPDPVAPEFEVDGRMLLNLASNSYLGLGVDESVKAAAIEAIRRHGTGAGASRLVTGTYPIIEELEEAIANLKETEAALVTPSGYQAAWAGISSLAGKGDGIILERNSHASLVDAARLSGASIRIFRRGDLSTLERSLARLRGSSRRLLVVTDGIFSMDGDIAPLPEILATARDHGAAVFIDDAHATGTIGPEGGGTLSNFGIRPDEDIFQMGTLSKALAAQGGFLAGRRDWMNLVLQKGRSFIYTTGLSPGAAGAALAAIRILRERPSVLLSLRRNAAALAKASGAPFHSTPIIPVIIGGPEEAIAVSERLRDAGYWAPAIRPPTVPEGGSRIRLSAMASHDPDRYIGLNGLLPR